jgi:hypothetical protein
VTESLTIGRIQLYSYFVSCLIYTPFNAGGGTERIKILEFSHLHQVVHANGYGPDWLGVYVWKCHDRRDAIFAYKLCT